MLLQTLTIARNTFLEAVRQPIYFILTAICGLAVMFTVWTAAYSMDFSSSAEVSSDNKMMFDVSMASVFVCGMLLAAFLATAVISKEIERKTVLTVVSKPVARPTVVIGKYLGVVTAIVIAVCTMLLFVQMAVRHEVMSTTADELDFPVIVFTTLAVGLALAIGIWCNFFYGWSFTQTTTLLMLPLMFAAWIAVLFIGKEWKVQSPLMSIKPQIILASICLVLSMLVLTAIATAASSRLGQVMTLVVCSGVFLLGLMSNHLLGRTAVQNQFVAKIDDKPGSVIPDLAGMTPLDSPGDRYTVRLEFEPRFRMLPGQSVYFSANPNGTDMKVKTHPAFTGSVNDEMQITDRNKPPAVVVASQSERELKIIRTGPGRNDGRSIVAAPPAPGDYLFLKPTSYNPAALAAWGLVPNIQSFWLIDAVSQNQPIPIQHVGLVAVYAFMLVGMFLSLGVILFQKREVG
jgi:ABC-type transport system involved in multi-copper enzyme maturation permease subunit